MESKKYRITFREFFGIKKPTDPGLIAGVIYTFLVVLFFTALIIYAHSF
jgi:hypothetical protein